MKNFEIVYQNKQGENKTTFKSESIIEAKYIFNNCIESKKGLISFSLNLLDNSIIPKLLRVIQNSITNNNLVCAL